MGGSSTTTAVGGSPAEKNYMGMSDKTTGIINNISNAATENSGGVQSANNYITGLIGSGGLSDSQTSALDYYKGIMSGGQSDPAFERLKQNAIDAARTSSLRSFGASGRLGSGSNMRDLGEGIANASANMDYQNLQRQDNAANMVSNIGQQGVSNATNASGMAGTVFQNSLSPLQTALQSSTALDQEAKSRYMWDPKYSTWAALGYTPQYQTTQNPGALDYLLGAGGLAAAFL